MCSLCRSFTSDVEKTFVVLQFACAITQKLLNLITELENIGKCSMISKCWMMSDSTLVLFFFFFFVFLQFCNVAEVAIIQKMIKANLATKKKWKWKEIKQPSMLFATLLEQNIKIWLLKKTFMKSSNWKPGKQALTKEYEIQWKIQGPFIQRRFGEGVETYIFFYLSLYGWGIYIHSNWGLHFTLCKDFSSTKILCAGHCTAVVRGALSSFFQNSLSNWA
jgi:hypothetical protein